MNAAVDALLPLIYDELRSLAAKTTYAASAQTIRSSGRRLFNGSACGLWIQARVNWQPRAHFFGVARQMMRHILVDHARAHTAEKRGVGFSEILSGRKHC